MTNEEIAAMQQQLEAERIAPIIRMQARQDDAKWRRRIGVAFVLLMLVLAISAAIPSETWYALYQAVRSFILIP